MVEVTEYLKLRERPNGAPVMYQNWRDLTFLHFSVEPSYIRNLIPDALEIDTFPNDKGEERAWIGLVPFSMTDVRLQGLPPLHGLSSFPETNVRTYVHREGKAPGVWFFSLDAANQIACAWARQFFGLPYHFARMEVHRLASVVDYTSSRVANVSAICRINTEILDSLPPPEPGSKEFFLIERYLLYTIHRGVLHSGQVHHRPYPLHKAVVHEAIQNLTTMAGIEPRTWEHFAYSPGVDVEVFGLQPVRT